MKSMNMIRRRVSGRPSPAAPTCKRRRMAASRKMGALSRTRFGPNFSSSPRVTANAPPGFRHVFAEEDDVRIRLHGIVERTV